MRKFKCMLVIYFNFNFLNVAYIFFYTNDIKGEGKSNLGLECSDKYSYPLKATMESKNIWYILS